MRIVRYPDPVLLQIASAVVPGSREADYIVRKLLQAIRETKWGKPVGMAAPQIGISARVFVIGAEAFLNPEIIDQEGFYETTEGCYSLDPQRFDYPVRRPGKIYLQWQTVTGEFRREYFSNFKAQIISHEFDHLQGRMCVHYAEEGIKRFTPDVK